MRNSNGAGKSGPVALFPGFLITGGASRPGVYPQGDTLPGPIPTSRLTGATSRWGELGRVVTRGPQDDSDIWELALGERRIGWLEGPFARGEAEEAEAVPVVRFLVRKPGKLRPVDYHRRSGVNRACRAGAPLRLLTEDHVATLANLLQHSGVLGVEFWRADHEAA